VSKKVLVLSASPRKGGNSDLLCDQFMLGAKEAGNQAEKIFLREKKSIIVWGALLVRVMQLKLSRSSKCYS
jgi:multimeric flavodoxin WrbA